MDSHVLPSYRSPCRTQLTSAWCYTVWVTNVARRRACMWRQNDVWRTCRRCLTCTNTVMDVNTAAQSLPSFASSLLVTWPQMLHTSSSSSSRRRDTSVGRVSSSPPGILYCFTLNLLTGSHNTMPQNAPALACQNIYTLYTACVFYNCWYMIMLRSLDTNCNDKKPALTRAPWPTPAMFFVRRDLDLWPFDPKINVFSGLGV